MTDDWARQESRRIERMLAEPYVALDSRELYGLWRSSGWWSKDGVVFGTGNMAYAAAQCASVNRGELHTKYVVRSFQGWLDTMEGKETLRGAE